MPFHNLQDWAAHAENGLMTAVCAGPRVETVRLAKVFANARERAAAKVRRQSPRVKALESSGCSTYADLNGQQATQR
jgi:hypothetical protein